MFLILPSFCALTKALSREGLYYTTSAPVTAVAAGAVGHRNQLILSSIYCSGDFVPVCFFGKSNLGELTLRNHQRWMLA